MNISFPLAARRRSRLSLLAFGMVAAAGISLNATASDDVVIKVTANLIGDCSVAPGGLSLAIGDVLMTDLAATAATSSVATGTLLSKGCAGTKEVKMSFAGTASTDAGYTNYFMPKDAKGVAIVLEASDDGVSFKPVVPNTAMDFTPKDDGSGWPFRAHLVRTAATDYTAGDAGAEITATITYP